MREGPAEHSRATLSALAEVWIRDLESVAHAITLLLDTLPANTAQGTRRALEIEAVRTLAIAAGIKTNLLEPDPAALALWRRLARHTATRVIAATAIVATGGLEAVGADAVKRVGTAIERVAESLGDSDQDDDTKHRLEKEVADLRQQLEQIRRDSGYNDAPPADHDDESEDSGYLYQPMGDAERRELHRRDGEPAG